jgi:hypothetical protein
MKTRNILSLFFLAALLITSCTKFEEGRSVMMVKSKLIGTWDLVKYEINGQNFELNNYSLEMTIRKDDSYTERLTVPMFGTTTTNGIWEFGSSKSKLRLKKDNDNVWQEYQIVSLSNTEAKIRWIEDGQTHIQTYKSK